MSWQLDPSHSHVGFAVKHLMVSTVRGQFHQYSATIDLDTADLTKARIRAEIDVASIDTREEKRDEHLRSADFFDAAQHPKIVFVSKSITRVDDETYRVIGDMTIRGTTREVTLDAEYAGVQKDPWGGTRTGFSLTGSVDRREFGLTWNAALETGGVLVGDKVKLAIEVELMQVPTPATVA